MLTDDNLTVLLRESFTEATSELTPADDLATVVRRRHTSAQRRRVAVRVAVPAVAAASVGAALALPAQHHASRPAASRSIATTQVRTPAPALRTVSYRVAFPQKFSTIGCVTRPTDSSGYTWVLEAGDCASGLTTAVIDTRATLPSDATPISIGSLTGLYGRTDGDSRTVWAPNERGGYWALTVGVTTSDANIAAFFTPSN